MVEMGASDYPTFCLLETMNIAVRIHKSNASFKSLTYVDEWTQLYSKDVEVPWCCLSIGPRQFGRVATSSANSDKVQLQPSRPRHESTSGAQQLPPDIVTCNAPSAAMLETYRCSKYLGLGGTQVDYMQQQLGHCACLSTGHSTHPRRWNKRQPLNCELQWYLKAPHSL
jgi:hypothetical protein